MTLFISRASAVGEAFDCAKVERLRNGCLAYGGMWRGCTQQNNEKASLAAKNGKL